MTLTNNDAYGLLLGGGGAPSAKWPNVGDVVRGTITSEPEAKQATDMQGNPKTWDDGNPIMEVVITIQTDERDPSIEDDDGKRRLFLGGNKLKAVREAIKESGHTGSIVGGTLAIQYTGDGTAKQRGFNPPKLFTAKFKAPAVKALGLDDI